MYLKLIFSPPLLSSSLTDGRELRTLSQHHTTLPYRHCVKGTHRIRFRTTSAIMFIRALACNPCKERRLCSHLSSHLPTTPHVGYFLPQASMADDATANGGEPMSKSALKKKMKVRFYPFPPLPFLPSSLPAPHLIPSHFFHTLGGSSRQGQGRKEGRCPSLPSTRQESSQRRGGGGGTYPFAVFRGTLADGRRAGGKWYECLSAQVSHDAEHSGLCAGVPRAGARDKVSYLEEKEGGREGGTCVLVCLIRHHVI